MNVDAQLMAGLEQPSDIAALQTRLDADVIAGLRDRNTWTMTAGEKGLLRGLACRVAELAARPAEAEKRALWTCHNGLEATRPVIFCDPENGWNEIIRPSSLVCRAPLARRWEMHLRKEIFWGEDMGDDYTVEPYFNVFHVHSGGLDDWGLKETLIQGGDGGSYRWGTTVASDADLDRLHFPSVQVDWQATDELKTLATEIFGDLLTVRLRTNWWWTLGMTMRVAFLRGLQQMLLDFLENPAFVHRFMGLMRDGTLSFLNSLEEQGLLNLNNDGAYVGSGGLGWTTELPQPDFAGKVRTQDMWGFAESQETIGISPRMFGEFIFPYQLPILKRFGLNCYGCCEPLDLRWSIIQRIPRLRRVSVSPWANVDKMAERLGSHYIMSIKPNPADLSHATLDEERIRAELRRMFAITRDCRVEAIMKDNHTLGNNPQNAIRWCRIAREEAERL
jgi:hypothetical protein